MNLATADSSILPSMFGFLLHSNTSVPGRTVFVLFDNNSSGHLSHYHLYFFNVTQIQTSTVCWWVAMINNSFAKPLPFLPVLFAWKAHINICELQGQEALAQSNYFVLILDIIILQSWDFDFSRSLYYKIYYYYY